MHRLFGPTQSESVAQAWHSVSGNSRHCRPSSKGKEPGAHWLTRQRGVALVASQLTETAWGITLVQSLPH